MAWSKQQQRADAAAKLANVKPAPYEAIEEYEEEFEEEFIEPAYEDAIVAPARSIEEMEPYWDDLALIKCWKSALTDFKYQHPSKFAPLQEAPRSHKTKLESAPLWYEPIASISTISLDSNSNSSKRKHSQAKKQQNSKKVKLIATTSEVDSDPYYTPKSPNLSPMTLDSPSPSTQIETLPTPTIQSVPILLPTPATLPPSKLIPPFPEVAAGSLPRVYPVPPEIEDVEPGLIVTTETPEQLLQSALWSWYNAGYQTALYHSAMGKIDG